MSQDHTTVMLMALVRWIDLVQSPQRQGQVPCFAWEQARGEGGFNSSICGRRSARLSPIYHWGRVCLLFYLQFLKLKMFLSQGIARWFLYSEANFPFFVHISYHLNIHYFSGFILVDFAVLFPSQSFIIHINADFCVAAIHQRLESDGTERVEGSMTQRLENILNSKCLFI